MAVSRWRPHPTAADTASKAHPAPRNENTPVKTVRSRYDKGPDGCASLDRKRVKAGANITIASNDVAAPTNPASRDVRVSEATHARVG
jgi:hypothetical protein